MYKSIVFFTIFSGRFLHHETSRSKSYKNVVNIVIGFGVESLRSIDITLGGEACSDIEYFNAVGL